MDEIAELVAIGFLAFLAMALVNENTDLSGAPALPDSPELEVPDGSQLDNIVSTSMSQTGQIVTFANAIAEHESGGNPDALNFRNNNPGNLKAAPDAFTGTVTERDANGFVVFPSLDAGWSALYAQINRWVSEFPSLSLTQFFAKYLGQSDPLHPAVTDQGNPFTYAQDVASKLGVNPNDSLGNIFG